jgi:hypothetical protein
LSSAAEAGSRNYLERTERVLNECDMIHEILTPLPVHILESLSPRAIDKFIKIITLYDMKSDSRLKLAPWFDKERHNAVCKSMLRSVLLPCTRKHNTKGISSSFAQTLIIETLDRSCNLTSLFLSTLTETDNSAILASNIHHLGNLKFFQYVHHCTDQVVQQLALHCEGLCYINLTDSSSVTDVSVHYMLELKKLTYVYLLGTSITSQSYRLLIAELPLIKNFITFTPSTEILENIQLENLSTIKYFYGCVGNMTLLTEKCPNIIFLTVYNHNEDLSNITALTNLVSLYVVRGNYELFNLSTVLNGIGHRLIELGLYVVDNVNVTDIITFCSGLKRLLLENCVFVPLDYGTVLNSETPHFTSVINLKIKSSCQRQFNYHFLRYYVNLEVLECAGLDFLDNDFICEALQQGAFRNLQYLLIKETGNGALTMRTVDLLMQHCEKLKVLGHLKTWQQLTRNMVRDLKQRIMLRNLALRIM